jgi:hypothetical protein
MKLLIKERGAGKTTGLIYASEATGYPIVTSSKIQCHYIKDNAEKMGCDIPDPLTVEDLRADHVLRSKENILFDNIETILEAALNSYLDASVVCATMTDVEKERRILKEKSEAHTEENEETCSI